MFPVLTGDSPQHQCHSSVREWLTQGHQPRCRETGVNAGGVQNTPSCTLFGKTATAHYRGPRDGQSELRVPGPSSARVAQGLTRPFPRSTHRPLANLLVHVTGHKWLPGPPAASRPTVGASKRRAPGSSPTQQVSSTLAQVATAPVSIRPQKLSEHLLHAQQDPGHSPRTRPWKTESLPSRPRHSPGRLSQAAGGAACTPASVHCPATSLFKGSVQHGL